MIFLSRTDEDDAVNVTRDVDSVGASDDENASHHENIIENESGMGAELANTPVEALDTTQHRYLASISRPLGRCCNHSGKNAKQCIRFGDGTIQCEKCYLAIVRAVLPEGPSSAWLGP